MLHYDINVLMNVLKRSVQVSGVSILGIPKWRYRILINFVIFYYVGANKEKGMGLFLHKSIFIETFRFACSWETESFQGGR